MNKLIALIFCLVLLITCKRNTEKLKIVNYKNNSKEISIIDSGYLISEINNNLPNGMFLYCDLSNHIKKIEWYNNNLQPYYTKNVDSNLRVINDNVLSLDGITQPKIQVNLFPDNSAELVCKYYNPMERFIIYTEGFIFSRSSLNLFENVKHYYIDDIKGLNELKLVFSYKGKDGNIIKTLDTVKINLRQFSGTSVLSL